MDISWSSDPVKNKSKDKIDNERGFVPMLGDLKGSIISNSDPKKVEGDFALSPLGMKEAKKYSKTNINEISAIQNSTVPDTSLNTTDNLIINKLSSAGAVLNMANYATNTADKPHY